MFVLTHHLVVERKVKIDVPVAGQGCEVKEVKIKFKILKESEHAVPPTEADIARARELGMPDPHQRSLTNKELLLLAVVGWSEDSFKESDAPDAASVPFSDEALKSLLEIPYVVYPLANAYFATASGGRVKN
jgi:hypothetical protein